MASGSSSQQNFRKAIEAIKDSTSVGIAKVNSEYKDIKVSILKATNHVDVLPKEKHVRAILGAVSGSRPRADVAYCIHTLTKRLAKTRSWVVALKTLIVIHRALREVDHSFCEQLIYHNQRRGHLLNLLHFKDDSSPTAWDNSTWIRTYALYIEECLECFRVLKYDFYRDHTRTKKFGIPALLEQLPALQQLLFRLLCCQPVGEARYNFLIQYALSIVAAESVRLYVAITDGVLILVDKFFEMQRRDAVRALEIYRNAGEQAQRLSEFFEMCRSLEFGRRQKYVKIEQPPASFLTTMEEYIKEAPQPLMLPWTADNNDECTTPKLIAVPDPKKATLEEGSHSSLDSQETSRPDQADAPPLIPDLLSWDDPDQEASASAENKSLPLVLATPENLSNNMIDSEISSEPASWELALVTTSGPDATSLALTKGGVLDRSLLDSLYNAPQTKPNTDVPLQTAKGSVNPFEADDCAYNQNMFYNGYAYNQNMFYDPNFRGHPGFMQEGGAHQQQASFMQTRDPQEQSMVLYDSAQIGRTHQQQAPFMQPHDHQVQSMVLYNYAQIGGTHQQQPALTEQYYQQQYLQAAGKQQESSIPGQDFSQMIEMAQVEGKSVLVNDSTNKVGNPFEEQISFPVVPQAQNPSSDFSSL